MKKENLKKQFAEMLEGAQDVYEFTQYGKTVTEHQMNSGTFRASFVSCKDDAESRQMAEEYIRKRISEVNRNRNIPRSVLEKRSNKFQQALAYISEHRHLVPLLVYVYNKSQGTTVNYWKLAKDYAKKNGGMPAELIDNGERKKAKEFDMCRTEDFYNAVAQVPSFPKAWLK